MINDRCVKINDLNGREAPVCVPENAAERKKKKTPRTQGRLCHQMIEFEKREDIVHSLQRDSTVFFEHVGNAKKGVIFINDPLQPSS